MKTKLRYWRVDVTHKMGYQAPSKYFETSTDVKNKQLRRENLELARQEAIKLAKDSTQLSNYPETWTFTAVKLDSRKIEGKWIPVDLIRRREANS